VNTLFGTKPPGKLRNRVMLIVAIVLLVIGATLLILTNFVITTSAVSGPSMYPTLHENDVLLIRRGYPDPARGDIVLIGREITDSSGPRPGLIKRVIAIPGDSVSVDTGRAFVDGQAEPDAYTVILSSEDLSFREQTLAQGSIFVLGDNRPISRDSRIFGPVQIPQVDGRAIAIIWPPDRARAFD